MYTYGMAKKIEDRHFEPRRINFTFPIDVHDLVVLQSFGKKNDRTRASLIREAVREWIERMRA